MLFLLTTSAIYTQTNNWMHKCGVEAMTQAWPHSPSISLNPKLAFDHPGICRQTDHGRLTPISTSSDSSMMTMPGPRGPTADEQVCGASRAHRCKETRRRYSATAKNATQAIRAAPATEATMGHQRKPAAAAPLPPPPDDGVVREGSRVVLPAGATAMASLLLARTVAAVTASVGLA